MPVVTVALAPHARIESLLRSVADAVAFALALGDGDVIASHIPLGTTVSSGGDGALAPRWVIVSIQGSDRGADATAAARAAAEASVREWALAERENLEGVWTQWIPPTP